MACPAKGRNLGDCLTMPADVKIYVLPASHPCEAVLAAAKLKRISYKKVNLLPAIHRVVIRAMFPRPTVPAAIIDGEKVQGSREIMRRFDQLRPDDHPLFPRDPDARASVEEAEDWADEVLQPLTRRLLWAHLKRSKSALRSYAEGQRMPLPMPIAMAFAEPVIKAASLYNHATDDLVRDDLANLPSYLDRIDSYIADDVIGSENVNVADLQIGATLALLMTLQDLHAAIATRPCGALALRLFPDYRGNTPSGILPAQWFENLREPATR